MLHPAVKLWNQVGICRSRSLEGERRGEAHFRPLGSQAVVGTDLRTTLMGFDDELEIPSGECHMCLAIPGKIIEIAAENKNSALVDVVGMRRRVDLGLLEDDKPEPGDWVLIHVGFAMSKISEVDALDQMRTLEMLG